MNKEQFQGQWNTIKGKIKEKWGKLTDQDLTRIDGKREQLLGELQKKYGLAKEKAEQELSKFESSLSNLAKNINEKLHAGSTSGLHGNEPSNPHKGNKNPSKNDRHDKNRR
jgi:uncharacterized protein YjbJ (UPF0337 family)